MYIVELEKTSPETFIVQSSQKPASFEWHCCLAHAGADVVRKMTSKRLVDGLHTHGDRLDIKRNSHHLDRQTKLQFFCFQELSCHLDRSCCDKILLSILSLKSTVAGHENCYATCKQCLVFWMIERGHMICAVTMCTTSSDPYGKSPIIDYSRTIIPKVYVASMSLGQMNLG